MRLLLLCTTGIVVMVILCQAHVAIGGDTPLTKPNCSSKCGDVNISFPFGFTDDGIDCYLPNFDLTCKNDTYNSYYTSGCISVCGDENNIPDDSCSGIGCCQSSIPEGLRIYNTDIESFHSHRSILDFNNCSYSFLVQKNNYTFNRKDLTYMDKRRLFPVVLDWSVGNQTCEDARTSSDLYACVSKNSYWSVDIDECQEPNTYFCNGTCTNVPGSYDCRCPNGTTGDRKSYGCSPIPQIGNKNTLNIPVLIWFSSTNF